MLRTIAWVGVAWSVFLPFAVCQAGVGDEAQWIWTSPFPRVGEQIRLRRTVEISQPLRRAELRGLADDHATVLVDDQFVDHIKSPRKFSVIDLKQHLPVGQHTIEVAADNRAGAAGVWMQLDLVDSQGQSRRIVTDGNWEARVRGLLGVEGIPRELRQEFEWHPAHSIGLLGVAPWWRPAGQSDDYDQWKRALGTGQADEPARVQVVPGFQVELLRSSQKGEGSWVSVTFDPKGRLIVGREGAGILRMTLPASDRSPRSAGERVRERGDIHVELINDTLQECRGLLWAFDSLYANANNSKGLYRLRDTDSDDTFDDVKLLKATGGGVGHGRNALALGPDNLIYVIHGNNVLVSETDRRISDTSPLRFMAEDRLRPAFWDRFLFDSDAKVPAGYVARTDAEGNSWQVVAGGFRNPYGLDFTADGELFTFDADNEGDQGSPWYRPTRINHIVSGGDYGFRHGSANRPGHFAEHLPSNLDMGLASPTGVKSGHRSNFPSPYREAMFVCDWSYGRIHAIHLDPVGASYRCRAELFLEGQPLNVTDLAFGPDGAMYFVTGGRGTQSGLYRVRFVGRSLLPVESENQTGKSARPTNARRELEHWHTAVDSSAIESIWPQLGHDDVWIRHAARVALEHQPLEAWRERALDSPVYRASATTTIAALLAVVRATTQDKSFLQHRVFLRLNALPRSELSAEQQLDVLRVYAVAFARLGRPNPEIGRGIIDAVTDTLCQQYPHEREPHNQRLCELLAFLEWKPLVEKTIPRLEKAVEQEDKLAYLTILRDVPLGWTLDLRKRYFVALQQADLFDGGNLLPIVVNGIREDALATLTPDERRELGNLVEPATESGSDAPATTPQRPVVREWKLEEFDDVWKSTPSPRDVSRGERLFRETLCIRCHRFDGEGRTLGPDLTFVASRFGPRDLLEHLLVPSKVIDGKYRQTIVETKAGQVMVGRTVGGDAAHLLLATDPLRPTKVIKLTLAEIETRQASPVSPMPVGMLNTLEQAEILDLLEFLRVGVKR